ncbi:MAG: hypothetical protein K9N23_09195 [Akkermansiaceae bacterium]|nr:hypothetical protein [Akkermansiaceae bacterium]
MKPNTLNRFHFCPILFAAGLATGGAHGAAVIIDDSDLTGFSQTGSWDPQAQADAQAGNWRYQNDPPGPTPPPTRFPD